jgi:glutamate synthase (NADPH/NADH) large chain
LLHRENFKGIVTLLRCNMAVQFLEHDMSTFPLRFQPATSAKASPLPAAGIPKAQGLYNPAHEHDACGVGFVAHIKGQKSHAIIEQGLKILQKLDHRGAVGADKLMGEGAGIRIQIPDAV